MKPCARFPGVVVLHDLVLMGFYAARQGASKDYAGFVRFLERFYPEKRPGSKRSTPAAIPFPSGRAPGASAADERRGLPSGLRQSSPIPIMSWTVSDLRDRETGRRHSPPWPHHPSLRPGFDPGRARRGARPGSPHLHRLRHPQQALPRGAGCPGGAGPARPALPDRRPRRRRPLAADAGSPAGPTSGSGDSCPSPRWNG